MVKIEQSQVTLEFGNAKKIMVQEMPNGKIRIIPITAQQLHVQLAKAAVDNDHNLCCEEILLDLC